MGRWHSSLNTFSVSKDAKFLAYGLSSSGSDWVTIKVMRVQDKFVEPDTLSRVKFSSISWTHDSKGFFYSRYPAPTPKDGKVVDAVTETDANHYHELYYHFLGTDQLEDILCWRDPQNYDSCSTPVSLELGGKSPIIVFEDVDLDKGIQLRLKENSGRVNKLNQVRDSTSWQLPYAESDRLSHIGKFKMELQLANSVNINNTIQSC